MNANEVVARLRNLLSFDTEPFLLTREMAMVLVEECEQQRTRAEAAEEELRELRQSLRDNAIEEGFRS